MSDAKAPPTIFARERRIAVRKRRAILQGRPDAARFVIEDMIEDVLERLAFLRYEPDRAMVLGDWTGALAGRLSAGGTQVSSADPVPTSDEAAIDEERPFALGKYDLLVSLGLLDTVNDLPGALIHARNALAPGGLGILSFVGAGSLPVLRQAMLAADGDRPAARIHPFVDVRAGAELLQRTGWADPVIDSHSLGVRYAEMDRLVADLREQGLGNVLASRAPPLDRPGFDRARDAFGRRADRDGRVTETFEIVTLSGRAPRLRRG